MLKAYQSTKYVVSFQLIPPEEVLGESEAAKHGLKLSFLAFCWATAAFCRLSSGVLQEEVLLILESPALAIITCEAERPPLAALSPHLCGSFWELASLDPDVALFAAVTSILSSQAPFLPICDSLSLCLSLAKRTLRTRPLWFPVSWEIGDRIEYGSFHLVFFLAAWKKIIFKPSNQTCWISCLM